MDQEERRRKDDTKIDEILKYISEGNRQREVINDTMTTLNIRCHNLELMVHGDSNAHDKYIRDGINRRVEFLEDKSSKENVIRKDAVKIAVGSIAIAIGGAIIWVFDVVRQAFIHKG